MTNGSISGESEVSDCEITSRFVEPVIPNMIDIP